MHSSIVGLAIGIRINQPVEVGKTYILTADISHTGRADFSAGLYCFDGAFSSKPITNSAGRASIIFTATSTSVQIRAGINATTAGVSGEKATIDNLSMRELKGNHCRQLTSSARPTYKTDGVLRWLKGDGVDDRILSPNFGLARPTTIAAGFTADKAGGFIMDGLTVTTGSLYIDPARPSSVRLAAGNTLYSSNNHTLGSPVTAISNIGVSGNPLTISLNGGSKEVLAGVDNTGATPMGVLFYFLRPLTYYI
ncbi:hypothetical protein ACOBWA_08415 [Psychrobacter sp. ER1]|uniref:hypothetical protein n=1 Tax=Psychrobacter sp. ER1 TaxID=3406645 RepID=UPI003B435D63